MELTKCAWVLDTFGKEIKVDQIIPIFIEALQGQEPEKVIKAVKNHLRLETSFPKPVCILNMLEGKNAGRDKPNMTIFTHLTKKRERGEILTTEQENYIQRCINFTTSGS